jgi:hypothetical protein
VDKDTIWEARAPAGEDTPEEPSPMPPWEDHERRAMPCRRCQLPRVFRRRKTRHSLHFILSIGTIGIWLPAWGFAILVQFLKPWTCSTCGAHQRDA